MFYLIMVLVSLTVNYGIGQTNTNIPLSPFQIEKIKRGSAYDELMANAEKIVKQSGNKEAAGVLKFLQEHAVLGSRTSDGKTILYQDITTNTLVAFVPLFPEDTNGLFTMKMSRDISGDIGNYLHDTNGRGTILVRVDHHFSWYNQGATTLHEGNHAKGRFDRGNKPETPQDTELDELRVWEFERMLHLQIGGKNFEHVVAREMKMILGRVGANISTVGDTLYGPLPYDNELDIAFGPAVSTIDRNVRRTAVSTEAYFRLMQANFTGDELRRRKLKFMLFERH